VLPQSLGGAELLWRALHPRLRLLCARVTEPILVVISAFPIADHHRAAAWALWVVDLRQEFVLKAPHGLLCVVFRAVLVVDDAGGKKEVVAHGHSANMVGV
jgi:hypothetical protein